MIAGAVQSLLRPAGVSVHRTATIERLQSELARQNGVIASLSSSYFDVCIEYTRGKIGAAQLDGTCVPHFVVDNVLSPSLVERINANWPNAEIFAPEIAGNYVMQMFRKSYDDIAPDVRDFWILFNEKLWPSLVASCAEALAPLLHGVFGDSLGEHFSLEWPLTLMQGASNYSGHHIHTHFYHAPHWTFTCLLYIDPEEKVSNGTALHAVPRTSGEPLDQQNNASNYGPGELEQRVETALDHTRWDAAAPRRLVDYKANRLFVFLDGPLALHSVLNDNPAGTPNPRRALENGLHARRRILRTHTKIHHAPFYAAHSQKLGVDFGPVRYSQVMDPSQTLSAEDSAYKQQTVRAFYRERIGSYNDAWLQYAQQLREDGPTAPLRDFGYDLFLKQVVARIP